MFIRLASFIGARVSAVAVSFASIVFISVVRALSSASVTVLLSLEIRVVVVYDFYSADLS